jgi:hypothetical protein
MWLGRFDEAFLESERARQLDPLSMIIAADNSVILYSSRQYDRAIEKFRSVDAMEPNFSRTGMVIYAYGERDCSRMRWLISKRGAALPARGHGTGRRWPTSMAAPASRRKPGMRWRNWNS